MKRLLYTILVCLAAGCAAALAPQTISITNFYSEAETNASEVEYIRGYRLLFTNCVAYSGTSTGSAREDLTGLTVTLTLGWPHSNVSYTATAQTATNGTWGCATVVPTNWTEFKVQVKIIGADTNVYPLKILKTRGGL